MPKPNANDYPEYFYKYISLVKQDDVPNALNEQQSKVENFLNSVSEERSSFAYAPGKWNLKELLQHMIDTERVFTYRALCIARKEPASLPSFDENLYANNSNANARSWKSLSNEFLNVRRSTKDLFESFSEEMWQQKGVASNNSINVLSLGFITAGHVDHHIKIAEEKYLNDQAKPAV